MGVPRKCVVFTTSCWPCRWKEKHCTIFQIVWSCPFSEEMLHEYGVSDYSTFCKLPLVKTANVVGEKRYYNHILANQDKKHLTGE